MKRTKPEEFMRRAIALAVRNARAGRGGPFGAVVVKAGRVIAEGTNRVTSANDPTAHAEVVAIRAACRRLGHFQLDGCEIYCSCEPCPMCLGAIYWARPARLYFAATRRDAARSGFDDSRIYRQFRLPIHRRTLTMRALLRREALAAFEAWRQCERRVEY
jgi:tRNA(Arg) A34 adenosine deaminase TadA